MYSTDHPDFLPILVRASIIFDSYRTHDIQFLDVVMISTTWDSNGHHVIREKINHLMLFFLNIDVSRQNHWRHSRRVKMTNDLQLSRRVHETPIYRQSLHEDIRFSYYWRSIIFPSYHENVSFCTHLYRLEKKTHVMVCEVITTREKSTCDRHTTETWTTICWFVKDVFVQNRDASSKAQQES